uniref:Uncharacterized protein n=1 Tax=Anopheles darlingi TaxID=43151 RepID=A0A2M4DCM7_ANODA
MMMQKQLLLLLLLLVLLLLLLPLLMVRWIVPSTAVRGRGGLGWHIGRIRVARGALTLLAPTDATLGRVHRQRLRAREGTVAATALVLLARHRRPDALFAQIFRNQRKLFAREVDEGKILEAGCNVLVVVVAAPVRIQRLVAAEHRLAVAALGRYRRMLPVQVVLQHQHAAEVVAHAHGTAEALTTITATVATLDHRTLQQVVVDRAHLAMVFSSSTANHRWCCPSLPTHHQLVVAILELTFFFLLLLFLMLPLGFWLLLFVLTMENVPTAAMATTTTFTTTTASWRLLILLFVITALQLLLLLLRLHLRL